MPGHSCRRARSGSPITCQVVPLLPSSKIRPAFELMMTWLPLSGLTVKLPTTTPPG